MKGMIKMVLIILKNTPIFDRIKHHTPLKADEKNFPVKMLTIYLGRRSVFERAHIQLDNLLENENVAINPTPKGGNKNPAPMRENVEPVACNTGEPYLLPPQREDTKKGQNPYNLLTSRHSDESKNIV